MKFSYEDSLVVKKSMVRKINSQIYLVRDDCEDKGYEQKKKK